MAQNINTTVIGGNLTRDPESRFTSSDKQVTKFTLAVNGWKEGDTAFVDIECWGKAAEFAAQYLAKGCKACVEGRLRQESWEDRDGKRRSKLVVVADKVHALTWANDRKGNEAGEPEPRSPKPDINPSDATDDEPPF